MAIYRDNPFDGQQDIEPDQNILTLRQREFTAVAAAALTGSLDLPTGKAVELINLFGFVAYIYSTYPPNVADQLFADEVAFRLNR